MDANQISDSRDLSSLSNVVLPANVPDASQAWQPRTELGVLLKALRGQFVASGGQLLSQEEIAAELQSRRGNLGER